MPAVLNQNNAVKDGLLVRRYGAGSCPICKGFHEVNANLIESGGSKAFVEVLFARMLTLCAGMSSKKLGEAKMMIGALVPSGKEKVLIAVSGNGDRDIFTRAANTMQSTIVCGAVANPATTAGGREITGTQLQGWKVDNEPLQCAAPKLIMEARRRNYTKPWDMTEVWFDPKMGEKHFMTRQTGYSRHGWSIASCQTCANVVPALLCSAS